jgi:pteridine reductase
MQLADRVVLVTGAAKRVGRAIAFELAARGARVVVHYRTSAHEAEEVVNAIVAAGGQAIARPADLAHRDEVQQLVRGIEVDFGYVDVLVHSAAEFFETPLLTTSDADWDRMIAANLTSAFYLARRVAPPMMQRGGGVIVNLLDVHAERYLDDHLAYCVSKAGLAMLTKGLARELAPNVRVNGVAPGTVLFPDSWDEERRAALRARLPLRREGTPQDVATAVRYLIEDGEYVTGAILTVDGGKAL